MKRKIEIGVLEDRRLLSVTAISLLGSQLPGATYVYSNLASTPDITTTKFIGSTAFNGQAAVESDYSDSLNPSYLEKNYDAFDSSGNLIDYGVTQVSSGVSITSTNSPAPIVFPASLVAGTVYKSNWTATEVSNETTQLTPEARTLELMSNTEQSVKVPAGTFNAYLVDFTFSYTLGGQTVTSDSQGWYAPGVGGIKQSAGDTNPTVLELTSYKVGTPPGGEVSGTVTGGLAGETIYLDANNNSKLDSNELSTTTGSGGAYSFSNVPVGVYIVRQVLPAGYTQTSPVNNTGDHITVAAGSKITGQNFSDSSVVPYTQLTGKTIGTAGSYANAGNTIVKATDGNLSTFFDGPTANGSWVGLDLGSTKMIKEIAFAPRSGFTSRMVGGSFQISTTANFSSGVTTIYTITKAPNAGSLTTIILASPVTAEYIRYLSPNGGYGDISEFRVFS